MIKKVLFILALFFIWFIFSYYTLDYSSGVPVENKFVIPSFVVIVIFTIIFLIKTKNKSSDN